MEPGAADVYAIIEDSGTQFRVAEGDTIEVDPRDLAEGQTNLEFERVLMIGDGEDSIVGQPIVSGASVSATIEGPVKGPKLIIQHFKRRNPAPPDTRFGTTSRHSKHKILPRHAYANHIGRQDRLPDANHSSSTCR